jgi:hypothetical protein
MRGLLVLGKGTTRLLSMASPFLPKIFLWFFILYRIATPIFSEGFSAAALKTIAQNFLAAELTLREAVDKAYAGTFSYTDVFVLIGAVMFIYYVIKWVGDTVFIGFTGSQAHFMAYVMAFLLFAVVEFSAISLTDMAITFIPIWDGIIYFLLNWQVLFANFDWWPFDNPKPFVDAAATYFTNGSVSSEGALA